MPPDNTVNDVTRKLAVSLGHVTVRQAAVLTHAQRHEEKKDLERNSKSAAKRAAGNPGPTGS